MSTTTCIWALATANEVRDLIADELATLVAAGKTDGVANMYDDEVAQTRTVLRTWDTTETATSWVAYLETLSITPLSHVISAPA